MKRTILITGGAGFVGSNLALRLSREGAQVRIFDALLRPGSEHNLRMLQGKSGVEFIRGDVRDRAQVTAAVDGVDEIYHLAAQVAVTSSVVDPRADLETNLLGTFNVLEAARMSPLRPFFLFTSTNKVYGDLQALPIVERGSDYAIDGQETISEDQPLDLHSPYGCSKGAAEQYVRDYARIYGLPTVVFRMSCIAGPRQFGNEDQGWLAHFIYRVQEGRSITIYGDGKQVRDVLHVADLVEAICAARAHRQQTAGQIFNIGGGPERAISLRDVLPLIEAQVGRPARIAYAPARGGDQKIFIASHARFSALTGWQPTKSLSQTIADIRAWRTENFELFSDPHAIAVAEGMAS